MTSSDKMITINVGLICLCLVAFVFAIGFCVRGCSSTAEVNCPSGVKALSESKGNEGGWSYDASEVEDICKADVEP